MTYNGWTNRETWLVNVWFNPESRDDVAAAREHLEEAVEALPDFLRDFCSVSEVNWEELESHFEEQGQGEEEEAGL